MSIVIYSHEVFSKQSVTGMKRKEAIASRKGYYLKGHEIYSLTHQRPVATTKDVLILLEMDESTKAQRDEAIKLGAKAMDDGDLFVEATNPELIKFLTLCRVEDKEYIKFEDENELNDAVKKGAVKDSYGAYFPNWYWVSPRLSMIKKSLNEYY